MEIRRYQNPDGTLTALGRKRDKKLSDKIRSTYNESYVSSGEGIGRRYGMTLMRDTDKEQFKNSYSGRLHSLLDFSDMTFKKGSVFARVSGTKKEDLNRGPIYGVMLPSDAEFYKDNRNTMTWSGSSNKKDKQYQLIYKAKEEIKLPGSSARLAAFYSICEDLSNRQLRKIGQETIKSLGSDKTKEGKEFAKRFLNMTKGKDDKYTTYAAYQNFILTVCRKNSLNPKHRDLYFNKLKEFGYNAMLDENNVGQSGATYPLILLEPSKSVSYHKSTDLNRKNTKKDLSEILMKNRNSFTIN